MYSPFISTSARIYPLTITLANSTKLPDLQLRFWHYIYSTYYMSPECNMVKYFKSRLIYFHGPEVSENKP